MSMYTHIVYGVYTRVCRVTACRCKPCLTFSEEEQTNVLQIVVWVQTRAFASKYRYLILEVS